MMALVTVQKTAMPETALCDGCFQQVESRDIARSFAWGDWDGNDFVDCTENDRIACITCGTED